LLSNKTILIISPESWGDIKLSKHHYSIELSKKDNNVYFLDPPKHNISRKIIIKEIMNNLRVLNYNQTRGINRLPKYIREYFYKNIAKRICKSIKSSIDIVWTFEPFRFQNPGVFDPNLIIYHPTDIHKTKLENELTDVADFIFAPSSKILNQFRCKENKKKKIKHGLAEHFINIKISKKAKILINPENINVGMVGNLNYPYLDKKTLIKIIKDNQNIDFYFIGPYQMSNISKEERNNNFHEILCEFNNFYLIGPKPSKDLPNYIKQFDIFLICYDSDKFRDELANPHKMMEYLSTGKIIVSHYIDEYKDNSDLLLMANSKNELPKLFTKAVNRNDYFNSEIMKKRRRDYAKKFTYAKLLNEIENHLNFSI
jgi:hypothetical protein